MKKTLVIIRHAHRNKKKGHLFDNGISQKGRKQSKKLRDFFISHFESKLVAGYSPILFSSPKIRCIETLEPLAKALELPVIPDPLLSERAELPTEKLFQFKNRINKFLDWLESDPADFVVISSHGDWIPRLFKHLYGVPMSLDKGGLAEIEFIDGVPHLRTMIQKI